MLTQAELAALPASLATSWNLGKADVYPATSGKRCAGEYIRYRLNDHDTYLLMDDDNDLGAIPTPACLGLILAHPSEYLSKLVF